MAVTLNDLVEMSQDELDDLFRRSPLGDIPDGDAQGIAIVAPATDISQPIMLLARWLAWRGKVVSRARGFLFNKVTVLNLLLFKARVYIAPSWYDGQPVIVLDYSKTSLLASKVRDEIRQVSPGLFLGIVFYGELKTINFVLDFQTARA